MKLKSGVLLRRVLIICCLLALVLFLNSFYNSAPDPNHSGDFQLHSISHSVTPTTKVILLWNTDFSNPMYHLNQNTTPLYINNDQKCIFTDVRGFLPTVDKYDAIIFHARFDIPNMPKVRDVKQTYIFTDRESPVYTWQKMKDKKKFYNITMTYRLDSDMPWPYHNVRDAKTNELIAPKEEPFWREPDLDNFLPSEELKQLIDGKNKSAAWFVSRCFSNSTREKLAEQLKKHINIDIFGKCGPLSCKKKDEKCYEYLDKDYKFYLSFENSLCIDYVTEKLFKALQRTTVPIVYGGADYNRFAPPHSYIDVQDFENVKELAKYLKYLEQNTTAYGEYFWWKNYYIISNYDEKIPKVFQSLCHYLHENKEQRYIENIADYWTPACTTKPRIKF